MRLARHRRRLGRARPKALRRTALGALRCLRSRSPLPLLGRQPRSHHTPAPALPPPPARILRGARPSLLLRRVAVLGAALLVRLIRPPRLQRELQELLLPLRPLRALALPGLLLLLPLRLPRLHVLHAKPRLVRILAQLIQLVHKMEH